jgi:hypothetical protein
VTQGTSGENRFTTTTTTDNCSTRVRDAIDRGSGAIRAQTGSLHRHHLSLHTQRLTANDPRFHQPSSLTVDRPISAWEEMFLPLAVREHLRGVTVPGPDGKPVPLVASERTLFQSTASPPPEIPPRWLARYLLLGILVGSAAAWLGGVARREAAAKVAYGLVAGGWELVAGGGTVLAGLWAFTDHVMAYRNENLFQLNPLALLLALALPFALRGSMRATRAARALGFAVAGVSALGLLLACCPRSTRPTSRRSRWRCRSTSGS